MSPRKSKPVAMAPDMGMVVDALPSPPPPPPSSCSEEDDWMAAAVDELERMLGYWFRDRRLLEEALTHSSHPDHPSYQRLEFVGDAALGLALTNHFFLTNPGMGPGALSVLRAANISTEKLARVAVRRGLYRFLRRNSPKLDQMVNDFTTAVMNESDEDCGGIPYGGDLIKAPKVLADIVESIAAAIYVDCNFNLEAMWKVFRGMLEPIITLEILHEQPVTSLYELCQKHGKIVDIKSWKKDSHTITNVFVDGKLLGTGSSEQKVIAKLNAARDALVKLHDSIEVEMEGNNCGTGDDREGSKQKLNELCMKNRWMRPVYRIEKENGPAHERRFVCSVVVEAVDKSYITYSDLRSKVKDAENAAAANMMAELLNMNMNCRCYWTGSPLDRFL